MSEAVVCEAAKVGLRVNTRKTENMKIRTNDAINVIIEDKNIQYVEKFVYLGCEVGKDGDIRNVDEISIGNDGAAVRSLERAWNESGIPLRTKLNLFNSIVFSVLLYGCQSWKGLKEVEGSLRSFESWCLRKIMKIRWFEMVSEEELRRRSGQPTIIEKLRVNQWGWYGQLLRMLDQRNPKHAMRWRQVGRRRVGMPKGTCERTIRRNLTSKGLDRADVEARTGRRRVEEVHC